MFITNAEHGNAFAVAAKTDRNADSPYRGISCFIVEKPTTGFSVGQKLDKLGYRGLDTCELIFDGCRVPAENLVGGEEGQGFRQVMSGPETGRINVAARAVGVATAAFEAEIRYRQSRRTFGVPIAQHQAIQIKLADMATQIRAARLLTYDAAAKKDAGDRVDLEAGMAKLFASEDMRRGDAGGDAHPRRLRLREGLPGGALLPGRSADDNRRRHERDAEAGHRATAAGAV